jgi:GNAT superfamily N-acetyltransferase
MLVRLAVATPSDASGIAALHAVVAEHLTAEFGEGHWSRAPSERAVIAELRRSTVYFARGMGKVIATLALTTRKPWAIDKTYFSLAEKPLYLTSMAIDPSLQRQGIGRRCMEEAVTVARSWPADAIRLDAYDAPAGAGGFYARCGFREMGRVVYRKTPLIYYELAV